MSADVLTVTPADGEALDRALARADAYRILAGALRDADDPAGEPTVDVETLEAVAGDLRVDPPPGAWEAMRRVADREPRAAEHRAIFGHVVAHGCPPYETEFGRQHVFAQSQQLGDIRGFYEAFGVRPRPGGERPDHVACELEFLGLLALKEASAIAAGAADHRDVTRAAAASFITDHAGRWIVALAGRIGDRAPDSGLAALTHLAASIVADHAAELRCHPQTIAPDDVLPIDDEADGLSFECALDSGDLVPPGA